ncbi:MAG: tetratricopeptide repeat protein [Chloroflexi bacterium]|nr:tetratricopeptide repeat protein [Chloroflexota bacterium]
MSTLAQDLALLETRGLLRVTMEQSKPIVRFKHALTRQATYSSILQTRRSQLHCAVAQTLTQFHKQPDLELVLSIAEHQLYCGDDAGMLEFLLPFAQRLIYTGRSPSLTDLLTRLNRAALNKTQQRDLDTALADAHAARGEYEAARELYEQVLTRADTDPLRARLLQSLGVAAYHLADYARAIESYQACLALAQRQEDIALQARATGGLGLAYWSRGETQIAEELLKQSRNLSLKLGESLELATAEYNLGVVQRSLGQYEKAIDSAKRAEMLYQKLGYATPSARTLQLIGACYHSMGDLRVAAEYYNRAIAGSHVLGDLMATAIVQSNLAELYAEQAELEKAVELYSLSIHYCRVAKHDSLLAYNLAGLSEIQCRQSAMPGRNDLLLVAQQTALEALAVAQRIQYPEIQGMACRVLAEIMAGQNELMRADEYAKQSIALLSQVGSSRELERSYRTYGNILSRAADEETRALGAVFLERAEKG